MDTTGLIEIAEWSVFLIGAVFVLIKSSGVFVEGSRDLGADIGIPPFMIGVVIVAFGTSIPELAASITAAIQGTPAIVIADVVGSNITNILLVMGVMAGFYGPVTIDKKLIENGWPIFSVATALIAFMMFDNTIGRVESVLLLFVFLIYLFSLFYKPLMKQTREMEELLVEKRPLLSGFKSVGLIVAGLAGILLGAHFAVEMCINIAQAFHAPVGVVSIIGIAVGTSLPELFVSLHAFRLGETSVALGNIYGSNAFNVLVVLGIPAFIIPIHADLLITHWSLPIMLLASVFVLIKGYSRSIQRWEGFLLLTAFAGFIIGVLHFL